MFLYINGKFTMETFKYESGDHLRSVTGTEKSKLVYEHSHNITIEST